MKWFRRKSNQPWEVLGCESVEPVPMFEEEEIDIVRVGASDTCGKYIFDFKKCIPDGDQCANALSFSQQQLMQEVARKGYNVLLLEGWALTRLRQGKLHRIEVEYTARPGYAAGKPPASRRPPFIAVLHGQRLLS